MVRFSTAAETVLGMVLVLTIEVAACSSRGSVAPAGDAAASGSGGIRNVSGTGGNASATGGRTGASGGGVSGNQGNAGSGVGGGGGDGAGSIGSPGSGGAATGSGGAAATGGQSATGGRGANTGGMGGTGGGGGGSSGGGGGGSGKTLDIYWIDVEGGAATLLVAPSGQTLLVDGGFPGNGDRDLNRILDVINNQVRTTKLDYVVTTHFHSDHVGGITALAGRFPVGQFLDHGPSVEGGGLYSSYVSALAGKTRVMAKAGDTLQLGPDVEILFVSSAGQLIEPLPTATANPLCANAPQMPDRPTDENPQSVGFLARFGAFDFLDLGDLTWAIESRLACPTNRIGPVDLFQISHHGTETSSPPQLVHALAPRVAVMNNGPTKGGAAGTFDTVKASPGLQDLWALHRAVNNNAAQNALEPLTANIATAPDGAYFIKASVARDGSYTLNNARNGQTRTYMSR